MTRVTISILALSVFGLGACTNPAYIGGNDPYKNTKQGALLGGLLGAGVAGATGGNMVKGAAIGAGAGAVVGAINDNQEKDLRRDLNNDNIGIQNTGDSLIVTLPQDITFATDSFSVQPGLRNDLRTVANNLNDYPESVVQVLGHTDNEGDAGYNQTLSERRANAVADALMEAGVQFERIQTIGRGEDQPVASNLTDQGRARNRRVEIVILPNG